MAEETEDRPASCRLANQSANRARSRAASAWVPVGAEVRALSESEVGDPLSEVPSTCVNASCIACCRGWGGGGMKLVGMLKGGMAGSAMGLPLGGSCVEPE